MASWQSALAAGLLWVTNVYYAYCITFFTECLAAAAKALYDSEHDAMEVCLRSMRIAADMCVYTNSNFVCDQLPEPQSDSPSP